MSGDEAAVEEASFRDLSSAAERSGVLRATAFFYGDVAALREDLISGWIGFFRHGGTLDRSNVWSVDRVEDFIEALDSPVVPVRGPRPLKVIVVRDADRVLSSRRRDAALMRLEAERVDRTRLLVLMSAQRPLEEAAARAVAGLGMYGRVREPSPEQAARWVATRSKGLLDFGKRGRTDDAIIPESIGVSFLEWCGWDWAAALSGIRSVRSVFDRPVSAPEFRAVVPQVVGTGFVEALVFGRRRRDALAMATEVNPAEFRRVLGLLRYHLRQFGVLRSIGAERMALREASSRSGIDPWRLKTKYRPALAGYTEEKIRRRLVEVSRTRRDVEEGMEVGVLESLAATW